MDVNTFQSLLHLMIDGASNKAIDKLYCEHIHDIKRSLLKNLASELAQKLCIDFEDKKPFPPQRTSRTITKKLTSRRERKNTITKNRQSYSEALSTLPMCHPQKKLVTKWEFTLGWSLTGSLSIIPDDVLRKTFSFLTAFDKRVQIQAVNNHWNDLVQHHACWTHVSFPTYIYRVESLDFEVIPSQSVERVELFLDYLTPVKGFYAWLESCVSLDHVRIQGLPKQDHGEMFFDIINTLSKLNISRLMLGYGYSEIGALVHIDSHMPACVELPRYTGNATSILLYSTLTIGDILIIGAQFTNLQVLRLGFVPHLEGVLKPLHNLFDLERLELCYSLDLSDGGRRYHADGMEPGSNVHSIICRDIAELWDRLGKYRLRVLLVEDQTFYKVAGAMPLWNNMNGLHGNVLDKYYDILDTFSHMLKEKTFVNLFCEGLSSNCEWFNCVIATDNYTDLSACVLNLAQPIDLKLYMNRVEEVSFINRSRCCVCCVAVRKNNEAGS